MVQQDNKPNNETTVDGKPLFPKQVEAVNTIKHPTTDETKEYVTKFERDDDPLLTDTERGNTRGDVLNQDEEDSERGQSHPI